MRNIRLSYSTLNTFLSCERLFQLDKLLTGAPPRKDYPSTILGKAFGEGIGSYLQYQDQDKALFSLFQSYYPCLEEEGKSLETCANLLMVAFPALDTLLEEWELAYFQGKPALELSFLLNNISPSPVPDINCYFVGYVDGVLRNRHTGRYAILENKTTGLSLQDLSPIYKNSSQALGYSIVLDRIAGEAHSSYDVIYLIGKLNPRSLGGFSPELLIHEYPKTLTDRLNWFITLGMDVERLERMLSYNMFPMRGSSCMQYMRPCKHFGTCHLRDLDSYKEEVPDEVEYQFIYDVNELIADHLERI